MRKFGKILPVFSLFLNFLASSSIKLMPPAGAIRGIGGFAFSPSGFLVGAGFGLFDLNPAKPGGGGGGGGGGPPAFAPPGGGAPGAFGGPGGGGGPGGFGGPLDEGGGGGGGGKGVLIFNGNFLFIKY